jgi:hypothetical protein
MMTTLCVLVFGLNSLVVYLDVKAHDVWERNTTTRGEIEVENIRSVKFWYIRGVTIRRLILQSLACTHALGVHSKLPSITHVATKVHVILHIFVVLTWIRDTIELV